MDEYLKQIGTKQKIIQGTRDAIKRAIENRNATSIERQRKTITKTAEEIYELKVKIHEIRIERGDNEDEIKTWTDSIERELETWDNEVASALKTTAEWKQQEDERAKLRELEMAAKEREEKFKQDMEFDKVQMEQKMQHELKIEKARKEGEKT